MKEQDWQSGLEEEKPADLWDKDQAHIINEIMLMRIYDLLLAQLTATHPGAAEKLVAAHAAGRLVGPVPAFSEFIGTPQVTEE